MKKFLIALILLLFTAGVASSLKRVAMELNLQVQFQIVL
jgi:hypothetical protein